MQPLWFSGKPAAPGGQGDAAGLERKSPGRTEIMFRALQNVVPSQLADRNLFDFKSLKIDDSATPRFLDVMNL